MSQSQAKKCLKIIESNTNIALGAETMVEIGHNTLNRILDLEMFSIKEVQVFQSAVNWAKYQCEKNGVEPTGANMREELGEALYKIRFPDIDMKNFANIVVKSKILNSAEEIALFCYFADKKSNQVPEEFHKGHSILSLAL